MYVWHEPASCWIYNLNTTVSPTWTSLHPESYFVPGRGYLYAVQAFKPTKQFVGNLNTGTINRALTYSSSARDTLKGFNFLGNPYPSSIDWRINAGYSRSMLASSGGGYWIWNWSSINKNYGVYNSADVDTIGTNNVTAYIAPMQGFFVEAASAGTFSFNNSARSHFEASHWLRSASATSSASGASSDWGTSSASAASSVSAAQPVRNFRLAVSGAAGGDEVKFGFGYDANKPGARKLFSPEPTAPSLYMNCEGSSFSTRRLTDTASVKYVAVNFQAGEAGTYTLRSVYDASALGTVYLEDRQTGTIIDLSGGDSYTFDATPSDAATRFVLHFGSVTTVDEDIHPNVWMSSGTLNVLLENMIGDYQLKVSDLQGRKIFSKTMSGGEQCSVGLFARGVYLVTLSDGAKMHSIKVVR